MDPFTRKKSLCISGVLHDLSKPLVMGILNATPDSFYDGGRFPDKGSVIQRIGQMIEEGASIIDVGGVSSRPGATPVSEDEETSRLSRVMDLVRINFPDIIVSIDTFRSAVARKMVRDYGAGIINDISSGTLDKKMFDTIAGLGVPYVAMHMQGTPLTMQDDPRYGDPVDDIIRFFADKTAVMRERGIHDIIIDPGFGFGKTVDHNYILAARLEEFGMLGLPVMAGFSRKSMICRVLRVNPDKALTGTIALNAIAIMKGVDILRVHDVREAVETIMIVEHLKKNMTVKS
jgi:dihydropteroate synthase